MAETSKGVRRKRIRIRIRENKAFRLISLRLALVSILWLQLK